MMTKTIYLLGGPSHKELKIIPFNINRVDLFAPLLSEESKNLLVNNRALLNKEEVQYLTRSYYETSFIIDGKNVFIYEEELLKLLDLNADNTEDTRAIKA